jgi:cysteine desulfurase/selenocysteine lyase
MSFIDIQKVRKDTPGCEHVLHFNNAGAALMPQPVIKAVSDYFQLECERGGYEAAALKHDEILKFYTSAATLINASPSEMAFIENATRAWDMVFYSLKFSPGDRIITSEAEYASNYIAFLQVSKKTGVVIDVIPNDEYGQISLTELQNRINPHVKLISITHIPTQGGLINPAEEVGKIAKKAGIFYLLDATQSVGQMPIDVEKIGCDALCATGRKFLRGPRGTGFLYVSKNWVMQLEPPFLDLHAAQWTSLNAYTIKPDAQRFETWETNYSNKLGITAAIDYCLLLGMESIWQRILLLSKLLRKRLATIKGVTLQDLGKEQCGIVTFTKANWDAISICMALRQKSINVSVSRQEYAKLDMERRGLSSVVRSSVHYYNTEEEVELFCRAIELI